MLEKLVRPAGSAYKCLKRLILCYAECSNTDTLVKLTMIKNLLPQTCDLDNGGGSLPAESAAATKSLNSVECGTPRTCIISSLGRSLISEFPVSRRFSSSRVLCLSLVRLFSTARTYRGKESRKPYSEQRSRSPLNQICKLTSLKMIKVLRDMAGDVRRKTLVNLQIYAQLGFCCQLG